MSLRAAGVEAHLDTYGGGFHGFGVMGKGTPLGKLAQKQLYDAFREACKTRFAVQPE